MTITTRVVEETHVTTLVTLISMTTHGGCPAVLNGKENFLLNRGHFVMLTIILTVLTDNTSNPDGGGF
jgi:hypothetical protein